MRRGQPLGSRLGLDDTRTAAETGRTRHGFGAAHGAASARAVPSSSRLPAGGGGARSLVWIARPRQTENLASPSTQAENHKNSIRIPPCEPLPNVCAWSRCCWSNPTRSGPRSLAWNVSPEPCSTDSRPVEHPEEERRQFPSLKQSRKNVPHLPIATPGQRAEG
jgi:hypothetical protein